MQKNPPVRRPEGQCADALFGLRAVAQVEEVPLLAFRCAPNKDKLPRLDDVKRAGPDLSRLLRELCAELPILGYMQILQCAGSK